MSSLTKATKVSPTALIFWYSGTSFHYLYLRRAVILSRLSLVSRECSEHKYKAFMDFDFLHDINHTHQQPRPQFRLSELNSCLGKPNF